jgi:hypothetical protein
MDKDSPALSTTELERILKDIGQKQEAHNQTQSRFTKMSFWANLVLIPVVGTIVAATVGSFIQGALNPVQTKLTETQKDVRSVGSQIERLKASNQSVITSPINGGKVAFRAAIEGTTPFIGKKHYVVVTPVENGIDWVQVKPVSVSADGSFTGEAQFGEETNGVGKKFRVRVLSTDSSLNPGTLPSSPRDAIWSDAITVTRQE